MAISRTAWIDDSGTGTDGTIINNAEKSLLYNQIDAYVGGTWVDNPFVAANYTASGGATWVPQQIINAYCVVGQKTMLMQINLDPGTLSGSPVYLYIATPVVLTPSFGAPFTYHNGSTAAGSGIVRIDGGGTRLNILRDMAGTPWNVASYIVISLVLRIP